ncbi:MAG: aa3-type cytochrome oxidase subunit CtaJ [Mycobacteriales bacterium]
MTTFHVRRGAAVITAVVLFSAWADPALARSDGEMPGRGLGLVQTVLVFVGIPLGLSALIGLLVVAAGLRHRPRYRPGRSWDHDPVWFAGPLDPNAALAAARPNVTGGGASAEW